MAVNRQLEADFGGTARLRYVDFDAAELTEFPDVKEKVEAGEIEPGMILVGDELLAIWDVPYSRMIEEFEALGATRLSRKAS